MHDAAHRVLEILDRQQIRELSQPANLVATVHLLIRSAVGALFFCWALILATAGSPLVVPVFWLCGVWHSFWGYAGIGHELYHARVFSYRPLNLQLFRFASYLTLNNPQFFAESHAFHHRNTFASGDDEGYALQKWCLSTLLWYGSVDLPLLARRIAYTVTNAMGWAPAGGRLKRIGARHQHEAIGILVTHLGVHMLLYGLTGNPVANLLFLLLPVTGLLPARLLAQSQHLGLHDQKDLGPLQHSRSLILPGLLQFLYAGMNFHAEHHLMPAVPYYRLPQLHALLVQKGLLQPEMLLPFLFHNFPNLVRRETNLTKPER